MISEALQVPRIQRQADFVDGVAIEQIGRGLCIRPGAARQQTPENRSDGDDLMARHEVVHIVS
jgi:hypothetical protein